MQRPTDNNEHDMGDRPQGQWSSGERQEEVVQEKQTDQRPNHVQLCRAGEGTRIYTSSWEREDGEESAIGLKEGTVRIDGFTFGIHSHQSEEQTLVR